MTGPHNGVVDVAEESMVKFVCSIWQLTNQQPVRGIKG